MVWFTKYVYTCIECYQTFSLGGRVIVEFHVKQKYVFFFRLENSNLFFIHILKNRGIVGLSITLLLDAQNFESVFLQIILH